MDAWVQCEGIKSKERFIDTMSDLPESSVRGLSQRNAKDPPQTLASLYTWGNGPIVPNTEWKTWMKREQSINKVPNAEYRNKETSRIRTRHAKCGIRMCANVEQEKKYNSFHIKNNRDHFGNKSDQNGNKGKKKFASEQFRVLVVTYSNRLLAWCICM